MKFFFYILIFIVAILEIIGDIFFKEWTIQNKWPLLFAGVFSYLLATTAWAFSLKYSELFKAVLIFGIITTVAGIIVGLFIYKESVSYYGVAGIILGIISIILLEF